MDFTMTHDRIWRSHLHPKGKLTSTSCSDGSPDPDGTLKEVVRSKIRHYRNVVNVYLNHPDPITFIPLGVDTTGHLYDEWSHIWKKFFYDELYMKSVESYMKIFACMTNYIWLHSSYMTPLVSSFHCRLCSSSFYRDTFLPLTLAFFILLENKQTWLIRFVEGNYGNGNPWSGVETFRQDREGYWPSKMTDRLSWIYYIFGGIDV